MKLSQKKALLARLQFKQKVRIAVWLLKPLFGRQKHSNITYIRHAIKKVIQEGEK